MSSQTQGTFQLLSDYLQSVLSCIRKCYPACHAHVYSQQRFLSCRSTGPCSTRSAKLGRSTSIPEKENNRSKRPPLIPWFVPNFFRGVGGGEIKDFLRTKIIIFHSNNKKKKEVKTQLTIHSINHIMMVLQSPPSCMGA